MGESNCITRQSKNYRVLLRKGWIERRGAGNDISYRITDKGLAAKSAPVRI
jgi:DNA-binding transcriptional regulator PaaX